MPRARTFSLAAAAGVLVALALIVTPAGAGVDKTNRCVTPSGLNLNDLFGVTEQIVAPGSASCTEVAAGETFRPSVMPWFMNTTFAVTPEGFVPAGDTPLDDFVAKFARVEYVIDPGTTQQRRYVFANDGNLWTGTFGEVALANPLTLGTVPPLPVGPHTIETYWVFSALHCDGFGDDTGPNGNCFPAGPTQLPTMTFEVTPSHF
jgi:hypothetical protein